MFDSLKCCNLHDLLFSETGGERVRGGDDEGTGIWIPHGV